MKRFYVIYLDRSASVSMEEVKKQMNKALDWYMVNERFWVLYSSSSAERLYTRLSHLAKKDGNIFISELNVENRQGWMSKSFWDWLKKDRRIEGNKESKKVL